VKDKSGIGNDPDFELALTLEEIALKDEYFVSRKLSPMSTFTRASSTAPWEFPVR
jgi:hypothetical protein